MVYVGLRPTRQHQAYIKALNHVYLEQPSLWQRDFSWEGFQWIDADNSKQSILIYTRQGDKPNDITVTVINFQTDSYFGFRLGVPKSGRYKEIFNSDEDRFGGSGLHYNPEPLRAVKKPSHGRDWSIEITVPPLGGVILKRDASRKTASGEKKPAAHKMTKRK